jgi:uncharacterized protein YjbJ (UPF0337 family)
MDHNRVDGSVHQAAGFVKEKFGAALGDAKLKTEGRAEYVSGKAQNAMGGMKDAIRDKQDDRNQ